MNRCSRCLTPSSYPGTTFNQDNICNFCLEHERSYSDWDKHNRQRSEQFSKLVDFARRKRKTYDVMVPLSGGKDSTYALYLATKKYKLKTLCCNFSNGFQSEVAQKNIKAAVEASGADLVVIKPTEQLLMKLYRHFFKNVGMFCPVCMRGIYATQFYVARMFEIPLVLKGTSNRTEEILVPEIFQDGRLSFFENVLEKYPIDEDVRFFYGDRTLKEKLYRALYILSNGKLVLGSVDIQMPDYFDWNYNEIYRVIQEEMGWSALEDRDEHVDCLADPTVHYMREIRCHDLTPNTLRYSAEIRSGNRERSEGLALVEEEMAQEIKGEYLNYFTDKIGITPEELTIYMSDNLRHMPFQKEKGLMAAFDTLRQLISGRRVR